MNQLSGVDGAAELGLSQYVVTYMLRRPDGSKGAKRKVAVMAQSQEMAELFVLNAHVIMTDLRAAIAAEGCNAGISIGREDTCSTSQ